MKQLTILSLTFFLLLPGLRLWGQCTTSAGTIVPKMEKICYGTADTISVEHLTAPILDANDTLLYMVFEGPTCTPGKVITAFRKPDFVYNFPPPEDTSKLFGVAAVAGNKSTVPGLIDWGDACLSISYGRWFKFSTIAKLTVLPLAPKFTCVVDSVTLSVSADQAGCSFQWMDSQLSQVIGHGSQIVITESSHGNVWAIAKNPQGCLSKKLSPTIQTDKVMPYLVSEPQEIGFGCRNPQTGFRFLPIIYQDDSTYQWHWEGPNGFTSENDSLFTTIPGTYHVTVTKASSGCTKTNFVVVHQNLLMGIKYGLGGLIRHPCKGDSNGSVTPFLQMQYPPYEVGFTPYSYSWLDDSAHVVSKENNLSGVPSGKYTLQIHDSTGCLTQIQYLLMNSLAGVNTTVDTVSCGNYLVYFHFFQNINFPYWIELGNGQILTNNGDIPLGAGTYNFKITDTIGCTFSDTLDLTWICANIEGKITRPAADTCLALPESPLSNWLVIAQGHKTFYAKTDANGFYSMPVDTGHYILQAIPPVGWLWENCSPPSYTLDLNTVNQTVTRDFTFRATQNCPYLEVDLTSNPFVRCFTSWANLGWCNHGSDTARAAFVLLQLDSLLSLEDVMMFPFSDLGNGVFKIQIGDVPPGECGMAKVKIHVDCDAALDQTLCAEAHIFPDTVCRFPQSNLWTGANLALRSVCADDSLRFILKNTGIGPLDGSVEFVVIEDCILRSGGVVPPLAEGDSLVVAVPANGSTWRVESEQAAHHPFKTKPMLSVEGCAPAGTPFTMGFVNHFPFDDADPWLDKHCSEVVGSYDPNDKTGYPYGAGNQHFIAPGTELTYRLRFQNTGTWTAFDIRIADTLSPHLDPLTLRPGPSSHPYRWDLSGEGILSFWFDDINLPDSAANFDASQGWVSYRISPRSGLPTAPPTEVQNRAAIYFDFNDPIFTNTTSHFFGENFLISTDERPSGGPFARLKIMPNPSAGEAILEVENAAPGLARLRVFDLFGNLILEKTASGGSFRLRKGELQAGVFYAEVVAETGVVASGRLVVF